MFWEGNVEMHAVNSERKYVMTRNAQRFLKSFTENTVLCVCYFSI